LIAPMTACHVCDDQGLSEARLQGETTMRVRLTIGTALLLASLALSTAEAQEAYPTRPVTLTIGFAAGGNGDIIARIVAEGLTSRLGQPVIVEPRPGAGGNTASARHVKSPPDGYSLTGGHAVSGALYKSLPFEPIEDFQMISTAGYQSFMIAVRADNPIKTVADLIAAAKAAPGRLTYSSVGVGSTQHLAGEWFCSVTGVKMTHVPYRTGTATMTDLLGGQIDVVFDTITVIDPQFRAGKAHVLGVTSGTRWWSTPDVAPVADTVPGYDVRTWVGVAAPKGLPAPIVKQLNDAMRSALADPAVADRLRKTGGMDVQPSSPDEMRTMVAGQVARWKKVVADANIPQQE
jgi:tripartite-type tricarboxylate transporter receptor subunit TctC